VWRGSVWCDHLVRVSPKQRSWYNLWCWSSELEGSRLRRLKFPLGNLRLLGCLANLHGCIGEFKRSGAGRVALETYMHGGQDSSEYCAATFANFSWVWDRKICSQPSRVGVGGGIVDGELAPLDTESRIEVSLFGKPPLLPPPPPPGDGSWQRVGGSPLGKAYGIIRMS
jgi:hypothetical protein